MDQIAETLQVKYAPNVLGGLREERWSRNDRDVQVVSGCRIPCRYRYAPPSAAESHELR